MTFCCGNIEKAYDLVRQAKSEGCSEIKSEFLIQINTFGLLGKTIEKIDNV